VEFQGIADFERTFKMRPWRRKMLDTFQTLIVTIAREIQIRNCYF